WNVQSEIGDGACGFRAVARRFLGDPELHFQARHQIVQYLNTHRHDNDLHITNGIGIELLYCLGLPPTFYLSYDDYIAKMSMPSAYMGQPEITAAISIFGCPISVH
ncbi:unnamed protein product, partial [Ectocarpus sp. 4 AP-2014]